MINYYPWAVYCEGPPSFIWGEGGAKNEGLLFQSTIDIHILNIFQLTVDIHFQNTLLLPLSLLLCSLLLPNCEGSHSVRLFYAKMREILIKFNIPEQFTAIGPPSFIWRGGGGAKKIVVEHFPEASAGRLFVRRFRRRFRPEEFSSAGDLLWRPTLRIRIRIRTRILIYRFLKYWGSLISDENSSGRSLWKVFQWKWKWKCF